jgi:hypothetical protein
VVLDPDRPVHERHEEEKTTRPLVNPVQFLIAISRPEEKGENRVLGGKEEDDGELRNRKVA